ncbi:MULTISPECIES: arsenic resistance N-acetyltransferase ArsN2 [Asticcacaulis]|uniref:arsenic resistance N-acetyltransferase ArsN2 n=1 Tax=Asticcacaulis TaxID=76890 RepID=UPI001AEB0FD1|nr:MULTISPECIES: arsenic resistance N-acetyltransferase ArsN2 [Asticcacaulis]MBP2159002.1 N-acetylglutamate synthase-like GNAT family acetyltransferase [Asticcacaulis solisilvae]MDR6800047.1 N-acetylglutamate synthase-like GNAT family acetyltransferase [Asticcacaulis sp. BE141]
MLERVANDDPALTLALQAENLPTADLVAPNKAFWRLIRAGVVVGYVGLELYGDAALLRSLVIDQAFKGRGLGRELVEGATAEAKAQGVRSLWLLTKTAQPFFEHLGWLPAERAAAPPGIRNSEEFKGLCPASAACLWTQL